MHMRMSRRYALAVMLVTFCMIGTPVAVAAGKYTFAAPIDQNMSVARNFGVRGVPMTYIIDRGGAIVVQGFGPLDFDSAALRGYVKALAVGGR